jgi:hypothetical protein
LPVVDEACAELRKGEIAPVKSDAIDDRTLAPDCERKPPLDARGRQEKGNEESG